MHSTQPLIIEAASYRQLSITAPTRQNLQSTLDIRPDNGDITRKLPNRNKEIAE
jgi:hypothetical protein